MIGKILAKKSLMAKKQMFLTNINETSADMTSVFIKNNNISPKSP